MEGVYLPGCCVGVIEAPYHIHYSPSSTLLLCVHPRYNLFAHSPALHTLSHCTSYPLFYFLFVSYFILTIFVYIYIYSLVFCFIVFIAFMLLCFFLFFFCTFHWADLSWLTFHYLLYPVWLCMWQIIKNLEPWTLNLIVCTQSSRVQETQTPSWQQHLHTNTHTHRMQATDLLGWKTACCLPSRVCSEIAWSLCLLVPMFFTTLMTTFLMTHVFEREGNLPLKKVNRKPYVQWMAEQIELMQIN